MNYTIHRKRLRVGLLKTIVLMKLIGAIFMLGMLHVSANVSGQAVTLSYRNAPFKQVIDEVAKQSGYSYQINPVLLKEAKPVTVTVEQTEIAKVLPLIFEGQPFGYRLEGNVVHIVERMQATNPPERLPVQPRVITGRVTNEQGVPLSGVTVKVSSRITITDAEGRFRIVAPAVAKNIEFSYLGYKSEGFLIGTKTVIDQVMISTTSTINEVVIKGYYNTTKELNTGNISTVHGEVINSQPITNPLQGLAGRVAGLQISEANGLPGAAVNVQIRGRSSINTNVSNNPLYIIDGVPFSSSPIEPFFGPAGAGASPLNNINPADIDRIEILKDADATAIYGSRGSNGVILITTKKGNSDATSIQANYNRGIGGVTRLPKLLSTAEYLQFRRDAFSNSGVTPTIANAPELFSYDQEADFNWLKWFIGNNTTRNDATISLNGGNGQTSFLVSGTYHDENTVRSETDNYRRSSFHLNGGHQSKSGKLKVNADVFYSGSKNKSQNGSLALFGVVGASPNYPVYKSDGSYNWINNQTNYVAQTEAYYKSMVDNMITNINLSYHLIDGLDFKVNSGYNIISNDQVNVSPGKSLNPASTSTPFSRFGQQLTRSLIFEPMITYQKLISKNQVELLIGGTLQNNQTRGDIISLNGYTNILQQESINFGTITIKSDNIIDYKYLSGYARIGYNWNRKYVLNATLRKDGSSRFGSGKQFASFGSLGAAWVFGNEAFISKAFPWLSYGKLRGSYGSAGNDGIPDYGYLSLYEAGTAYGTGNSLKPSQVGNKNYAWEVNKKMEIALELGLFGNRIALNSAFYRNRSGNQLVGYPLPSMTGFTSYQANLPALVQNKGWEFELSSTNIQHKDFRWVTSANLTIATNTLLRFDGIERTSYANNYVVGKSLSIVQGYEFTGVDPANGIPQFKDQNNNGLLNRRSTYNNQDGDFIIIGQIDPKWFAGMDNSLTYRGLQLSVFLQYVRQDGYLLNRTLSNFGVVNTYHSQLNYWKKDGDVGVLPKPMSNFNTPLGNYSISSATFGDASFLRMKNVNLSYTVNTLDKRFHIKQLRLYFQGQNLLTLTDYKGYDPETANSSTVAIPPLKLFTLGIQVSL